MLETHEIKLHGPERLSTVAILKIEKLTTGEAKKRALKFWMILWACTIPSLFIPLAHFILVPIFVVAGPIAYLVLKERRQQLLEGRYQCLGCQTENIIPKQGDVRKLESVCEKCRISWRNS